MKKITFQRRLLSLTLAASVALPQASSAFAVSQWSEEGTDRRVAHAIESGQPESTASSMPWITLPPDDRVSQPEPSPLVTAAEEETMSPPVLEESPPTIEEEQETPLPVATESVTPDAELPTESAPVGSPPPAESEWPGSTPGPENSDKNDVDTPVATSTPVPENTPVPTTTPEAEQPVEPSAEPTPSTEESAGPEEIETLPPAEEEAEMNDVDTAIFSLPEGSGSFALSQWMRYRLGYGVKISSEKSKELTDLENRFAVESSVEGGYDAAGQPLPGYGYRDYGNALAGPAEGEDYDRYSLCVFPSEEALGRVPDQQFVGWYVYPSGAKEGEADTADAKSWYYGDIDGVGVWSTADMSPVALYPYGSGDPYYDAVYKNINDSYRSGKTFGELGSYWDGGRDYGYGYEYIRDENGDVIVEELPWWPGEFLPQEGDGKTNPVSFVGRWEASAESRASKATFTAGSSELALYGVDIAGKPLSENTPVVFSPDRKEYWLRVSADVDTLSLDLSTLELYFADYDDIRPEANDPDDYGSFQLNTDRSHVQVSSSFGGEATSYTDHLSANMLPKWETTLDGNKENIYTATNTTDTPAHSQWQVTGIELKNATPDSLYNDIIVTITAPNDIETTTYVFHVQRLSEPTLTQAWGNTPVGMIRRDHDGNLGDAGKAEIAETNFVANRKFDREADTYPNGSANQNGSIFRDVYSPYAWPVDQDVDIDPNAIVVYQDTMFRDPGISLTDAEGNPVAIADGQVSRSLRLKKTDALSPDMIGKDMGEDCWYLGGVLLTADAPTLQLEGKFSEELTFESISQRDGSDVIDLRNMKLLPGIYTIEYRYTDPISGSVYGSDPDAYVTEEGKAAATFFRRTLVILPTPGDVDMDGAVTMADALALRDMLGKNPLGYTTLNNQVIRTDTLPGDVASNDLASLFAYRVCDVNYDGVLDDKDIQLLLTLPNPKPINETKASNSDLYYIALPSGDGSNRYDRKELATVSTDVPRLEMNYLGKEGGTLREAGFTDDPTGPWSVDPSEGAEIGDIFWLGVKLADVDGIALEAVKSLTFTLAYDTRYVEPVVVLDEKGWNAGITESESEEAQRQKRWENMMRIYNLGTAAEGKSVWRQNVSGTDYSYELTLAAGTGKQFTTHYSTGILPLENTQGGSVTERGRLQTVTFSLELKSGMTPVLLQGEGEYIFALPFRLTRHPFGQKTAQLVQFEAGMRGFTLVGTGGTTYAYSTQEKIFGGSTENLADHLGYGNVGAEIPLGEDKTEVYQVYNFNYDGGNGDSSSTTNGVYAYPFLSRGGKTASGSYQNFTLNGALSGQLPPGLTYHIESGYIDGTPQQAGTYEFYIGNIPYRMVIDKADLHFWADNQSSFYGQTEFRGRGYSGFTFRYDVDDICSFERERAVASGGTILVDGNGAGLVDLLRNEGVDELYLDPINQPGFTAMTEGGAPVTNATSVGTYSISNTKEPKSTNYNFIYSPDRAGGSKGLTILPRPIQVKHINGTESNKTVVGSVFSDQPGVLGERKAWRGSNLPQGAVTYTVRLATTVTDEPGYYNGLPLTEQGSYTDGVILPGDALEITYSARYIRNAKDIEVFGESSGLFALDGNQEEYRDVRAQNIRLTGGTGSSNYWLVSDTPDQDTVTNGVVGLVVLRRILALRISQLPPLEYQYGDQFNRSNELHYYIKKDGDVTEGQYRYSDQSVEEMSILVYWATEDEVKKAEADENGSFSVEYGDKNTLPADALPLKTGQTFTTEYDGRYLCMSTLSADATGKSVILRRYADRPLTVRPKSIVLTATSARRYYGEENGTLAFTNDPAQLAVQDWREGLTGAGEELLEILKNDDYTPPKLEAVASPPKSVDEVTAVARLTRETKYTGSANSVIIYGAGSRNYQFLYRFTNAEGVTTVQESYGASTYRIERRPIVLEEITTSDPLVEIYADTHRIYTDNVALAMENVRLGLPEHTSTTTSYYPATGSAIPRQENIGYADTATAVVNNDSLSFTYTATVVPTDGKDYVRYIDFSRGYFKMDDVGPEGYKEYPVQVSNLRLTGADADNYTLVYKTPDRGVMEMPNEIEVISNGINPEINAGLTYYAAAVSENGVRRAAVGRVWLRPIEKIEIITAGRQGYTYGETYDASQADRESQDRRGMIIHIEYRNDEKNNYDGNPYIGEVTYRVAGTQNGQVVTSFDNRSLKIYYVKDGQSTQEAIAANQLLGLQSPLYVKEHNGAALVVTGQRGGQSEAIISAPTETKLRISPKELTLRANDQRRVYGEANPTSFDFTFSMAELAKWDREKLTTAVGDRQPGKLLGSLDLAYQAPAYGTEATERSDVRNEGREGYEIKLAAAGALENYVLKYEPGTLYIYPRPVKITKFSSSGADPIYTIFSDVDARIFWTNVDQKRFVLEHSTIGGYMLEDGTILRTTGNALCNEDAMTLRVQVAYPEDLKLDSSEAKGDISVKVRDASIVAGTRAAGNYVLETSGNQGDEVATIVNKDAVGRVELRDITTITVSHYPNKMTYTYGEALDLSGLEITINYNTEGSSGTGQTTIVPYMGSESFAQYGLYVNYYDSATLKDEYWGDIKDSYRAAATGDHVTIAPTHDSQLKGSQHWFSANGKYLIVTAQRHAEQEASKPQIIPIPITVNPLPITFDLAAEDKIYNGNTQAAGTITFTNIFNRSGRVDAMNLNGVTDVVYAVTGATYENRWGNQYRRQEVFDNFSAYVGLNGYAFTTGSYVPNDPSILTENKTLAWTEGYVYGTNDTMTFAYLDPNVAYAQTPQHDFYGALAQKDVQVTGLRLAGPDAANYTLVGQEAGKTVEVTTNNVSSAQGYRGSSLPTATVHKANRAVLTEELLPQVEVDPHTNVVRVEYDQSLSAIIGGEENGHTSELHFEFALQKLTTEEQKDGEDASEPLAPTEGEDSGLTLAEITQWAGQKGTDQWGDVRYFGGEAAPMTAMDITSEDPEAGEFVPREEDIPKEDSVTESTTIKGQVYQWKNEDEGFVLDPSSYPGGVIWPGYELYTTDRTALDRDAIYLPVVRAAETHNYNPSPAMSSVAGYTPAMIQAILDAREALERADTEAAYQQAEQALKEATAAAAKPLEQAILDAKADAQAELDALMAAGEDKGKLEERPQRTPGAAVKTYKQVIETVSLKEMQGAEAKNGAEPYEVPTLEAIWFTDLEEIPSKEVLDAALWNTDPVRYRTYAWDRGLTVELTFDKDSEPISLREPFEVTVSDKKEENVGEIIRVNEDHNARMYVDTTFPSVNRDKTPEKIAIRPGSVMAVVGDETVALEVVCYPERSQASIILWSSSDPAVVAVDNKGRLTFLSPGNAVITATVPGAYLGAPPVCTASITVTVVEDWKAEYPNSIFDFGNLDAFLVSGDQEQEEQDRIFQPEAGITRGEAAKLLAQFYIENPAWDKTGPEDFPDVTGEEDYAEAARLLGSLGVFQGYPEGGAFCGEQYISRAEFVTLLARMTGLEIVDTTGQEHAFLDTGELDTWAYSEIDALSYQTSGVLLGVGEGYFAPERDITRSEVAALLTRLLRFPLAQTGEELIVPTDVEEDHWARECILRAVNGSKILEESLLLEEAD